MYSYDLLVDFEFDSNGDGFPDTYVEGYDTTGDGIVDTSKTYVDTNGDGYLETIVKGWDTDHNGTFDTFDVEQDSTGDGLVDTIIHAHDYNQDGLIDSITTYEDANQDGQYDTVTKAYDSDHDGEIDKIDVFVDANGSGSPDVHSIYDYDPTTGQIIPALATGFEIGGTIYTELEQFQPDANYPEGVSGDPVESMSHWEFQGDTNRCALYSQKFVIEELDPSNGTIDIEEFAQIAKEHGWFTEEGGTSFLNMNHMLDYYGIENEMTFHNTIDDIEDCLNQGGKVIVSIDSGEIWFGEDDNVFAPESSSDHAVEVIGIDRTDPEHPMVILNDSGSPNGKGEKIPLDVFQGAWDDGDCQMIKCFPKD